MLIDLSEILAERSYLPKYEKAEEMHENWQYLKEELLSLIDYKLSSSNAMWYQEKYMYDKFVIDEFTPHYSSDINKLPKGIVAETLFLQASRLTQRECFPCLGQEDVMGADFRITYGKAD